jgi:hypothetical protein
MVLGTTYYNAARSAAGTGWNRAGPLPAFRNACLAVLALTGAVVVADANSPPAEQSSAKKESTPLEDLPAPEAVEMPVSPPSGNRRKPVAKAPTSVLLPPIQSLPQPNEISSSSPSRPPRPSPNQLPLMLLEPPPAVSRARTPAAKTKLDVMVGQPPEEPHAEKPSTEKLHAEKPRLEQSTQAPIYQALEQEINKTFPGSAVHLKQVGDKLVVSGTARNIFEAARILTLARENAPGYRPAEPSRDLLSTPSLQALLNNYAHAGGPHVVNLLRIPGEQQIMLRVVIAEVNRAAARSLGLDFGIGDKQATVLPSRPAAADGSSTVAHNGWIGQLLRTLQDLHYAQSLAEPTLTTLNGKMARFQAGGAFPVPVISPSPNGAVQGVVFRSYGVHLSIQPVVTDLDCIRLAVEVEVRGTDPQATTQVGGTAVPGLEVRNFQSTVELREGETLAVADLIRSPAGRILPQNGTAEGGDQASSDQELVVLISPLLLHPPSNERGEGPNPLNPHDIELYLRSRNTIVPRGDALFLIGPQGYAGNRVR